MQKRTIQSRTKQGLTVEPKQECRSFTQPWLYTKNLSEFCHVLNQLYQSNLPATMRSARENDLIKKQGHPKYAYPIWDIAYSGVYNISKSANGSAMTPEVNDAGQEFNFYFLFIPFFLNAGQEN